MELTFEYNGIQNLKKVESLDTIEETLNRIEPSQFPYVILTKKNGDYIQCAGGKTALAVEVRFYQDQTFKHYIIGHELMSKVWAKIECKVGPIHVLDHEVLNIDDAVQLFNSFYKTGELPTSFNKRNITRQFKE